MNKKYFFNPEIEILWFDEAEVVADSVSTQSLETNREKAAEGSDESVTTIIKASELQ